MKIMNKIKNMKKQIGQVLLVAVTKTRTIEEIKEVIEAGAEIIAESRIQEAEKKFIFLKEYLKEKNVEFHFIGKLQSNKIKKAVGMFDLIQSVDSLKLAQEIDKRAREIGKIQYVLIEINIGKEEQKSGILIENIPGLIKEIKKLGNLRLLGIMCVPPFSMDAEDSRPYFREMKKIFDTYKMKILSMGMTNDYKIAIEEGSNMVRIGTGIFGERKD